MTVSVVVPVWNGRAHLERLLASLKKQSLLATETIVVDNGSSDGAGEYAKQWGAHVIRIEYNQGFAAAVNRGVKGATGELLAILNSDVELDSQWTEILAAAMTNKEAGFASGLILSAVKADVIDGAWDLVSRAGLPWRAGSGSPVTSGPFQKDRYIASASFTAILLRHELWDRVGGLDERFESYLEDVDFGLRCSAAGYRGIYVAAARCKHFGSAALGRWAGESVRRMSRNQVFLVHKYNLTSNLWSVFTGQILWGLLAAKHGAGPSWLLGKWQGWKRRSEMRASSNIKLDLDSQEQEIFRLQREVGFDTYWLWYMRLTGRGIDAGIEAE